MGERDEERGAGLLAGQRLVRRQINHHHCKVRKRITKSIQNWICFICSGRLQNIKLIKFISKVDSIRCSVGMYFLAAREDVNVRQLRLLRSVLVSQRTVRFVFIHE